MDITHNYKSQTSFARLRSVCKYYLVQFINQNPQVFEALCRSGSPFGGSCLAAHQYNQERSPAQSTQAQLVRIQQQLETLTQQVARLSTEASTGEPLAKTASTTREAAAGAAKQIGINRFWALQAQSHTMA